MFNRAAPTVGVGFSLLRAFSPIWHFRYELSRWTTFALLLLLLLRLTPGQIVWILVHALPQVRMHRARERNTTRSEAIANAVDGAKGIAEPLCIRLLQQIHLSLAVIERTRVDPHKSHRCVSVPRVPEQ